MSVIFIVRARDVMTQGCDVKCRSTLHMCSALFLKALEAIKFNEPICYEKEGQP